MKNLNVCIMTMCPLCFRERGMEGDPPPPPPRGTVKPLIFVNPENIFFFRKTILSHFTFYAIFNIKKNNIEKCPFTCWLNGRLFLQIVDRDSWNIYPLYPLFLCSDFVSHLGGGG